jgi:hypothetical protein
MNTLFATYAWNSSPIDGTDLQRSFVAKARWFPYPLKVQEDLKLTCITTEGEAAISHVKAMFPLWKRQLELHKLLNNKRQERHWEMANQGKTTKIFQPGDLVIVWKQVQSKDGKPAKLQFQVLDNLSHYARVSSRIDMTIAHYDPVWPLDLTPTGSLGIWPLRMLKTFHSEKESQKAN